MIVIDDLQSTDGTGICAVQLSLVNHTDCIPTEHSIGAFQGGLGNIKDIGVRIAEKCKLIAGKILKDTAYFVHIYAGTFRVDILNLRIIGRSKTVNDITQTAAGQSS